ncbi:MAG: GGDEF domain-containing protein [Planctomycetota bacterium]|nr:GGDEF domain-containing protein [Planctomycetota bacterium]
MSEPQPPKQPAETIRVTPADAAHHLPGPKRAYLTVIRGGQDLGVTVEVQPVTTIGRAPEATFTLQDLGVSREHACVTAGDEAHVLEDVGSTNGTRVNGRPLQGRHVLRDGDKIVVGESVLRFGLADDMDIDFQTEIGTLVGTDPLTGLESKRRFDDALDYGIQVADREGEPLALLMMDMDGVKQINDTHGHLFGAHVIAETGRIIALHLGNDGHAARFGGDEFCAFLPGRDKERACNVAEHIREAIETAGMQKDGIPLKPTISIGVGVFPADAGSSLDLVAHADAALYRAKAAGKNCVRT